MIGEGIHRISMEDYCADPCPEPSLSSGICKTLLYETPAKAQVEHPRLNPNYVEDVDDKFDLGNVAHSLFLEGLDMAVVVNADDWRTKVAKEQREVIRASGKIPLLPKQYDDVCQMVSIAQREWPSLKMEGEPELTLVWQESGGIWLRCRPDWMSRDRDKILHFKTSAQSVSPSNISRTFLNLGYDIAEAFYRRGVKAITGKIPRYEFFVQETQPPYLCISIDLSPQWQAMADEKVETAIGIWRKCITSGQWPGYDSRVYTLDPPPWAIAAWEEKRFALEMAEPNEEGL